MIDIAQHGWLGVLFALFIGHALADYPLQQEFIAEAKKAKFWKDQPDSNGWEWALVLGFHSFIHGGLVWWVTGNLALGFIEVGLHFFIDHVRSQKRISFTTDQLLHLACKVGYLLFLILA